MQPRRKSKIQILQQIGLALVRGTCFDERSRAAAAA
jgi:hypothetical protein